MPRVAVVTSHPPFTEGGHLVIARQLVAALRREGHDADLVLTPQNRFGRQGAAYLATWLTDVGASDGRPIDQVISLRFPSYAVRHPRHVCWLNHTMREYYDLWPQFRGSLSPKARLKEDVRRRLIRAVDRRLLASPRIARLFAQSRTVEARLLRYLSLPSAVLYPPPPDRPYRCDAYDDYFFAVSRAAPHKRLDLLVRAAAEPAAAGVRLVIAGDGEQLPALMQLAVTLGVDTRVTFLGRIDEDQLLAHYGRCRAVCFVPFQEDYGFVTAEAFASRKAVLTTRDSGGPAELVGDGREGLVCEPSPPALALAMAALAADPREAARMGDAAARRAASWSWTETIRRLLVV